MKPTTTPFPAILTNSVTRFRAALKRSSMRSPAVRAKLMAMLATEVPPEDREVYFTDFAGLAHDHQLPPERANSGGGRSLEKVAKILARK
jgi:hypothetical protein